MHESFKWDRMNNTTKNARNDRWIIPGSVSKLIGPWSTRDSPRCPSIASWTRRDGGLLSASMLSCWGVGQYQRPSETQKNDLAKQLSGNHWSNGKSPTGIHVLLVKQNSYGIVWIKKCGTPTKLFVFREYTTLRLGRGNDFEPSRNMKGKNIGLSAHVFWWTNWKGLGHIT